MLRKAEIVKAVVAVRQESDGTKNGRKVAAGKWENNG